MWGLRPLGAQAGDVELWCSGVPQGEGMGGDKDVVVHVCSGEMT